MKSVLGKVNLNKKWFLFCRLCLVMLLLCKQGFSSWIQLLWSMHKKSSRWLMRESMVSVTSIDFWFLRSVFCSFLVLMVLVLLVIYLQRGLPSIGLILMLLHITRALKMQLQLCFILSDSWGITYAWKSHAKFTEMICAGNCQSVLCIRPIGLMQG